MTSYSTPLERSNYRHLVLDIGWFAIALAATSRFMQFYAIRMGADAIELGLLTALPAIILVISTSLSAWWRSYFSDSVHALILPSFAYRFVFLLPAFAPFFPLEWRVLWLIMSAVLPAIGQGMSNTIFVVMMRETVTNEHIDSLLTRRQFALNVMLLFGMLIFGILLEIFPFPLNYQVMFVVAFIFSMVSQWHLGKLNSLVEQDKPAEVEKGSFKRLMKTDNFQSVAYVTMLSFVGYFSIFAIVPLFLERQLGADEGYMAMFGIVELIGGAGITLLLGPILSHLGSRALIAISIYITAVAALAIAFAPTLEFALLGAMLTGIGWNSNNIATLRFYTERTAANDMGASTTYHQIIFTAMFIGPILGSLIAGIGVPLVAVMLFGGIIRFTSAGLVQFGLRIFGKSVVRPTLKS